MKFEFKPKKSEEEEVSDEPIEEEAVDEDSSVEEVDDNSESVDTPESDEDYNNLILELSEMMVEKGEGAVRDYLYNSGHEIDDVDRIIEEVHRAVKSGAKIDGKGMYVSGGVKSIVDEDSEFIEDFDEDESEEDVEEKPKKKLKKSEFDDPVEEVYHMLKEGDPIPIKLAEKLLGNQENFERLLAKEGVEKSKYQVFIRTMDEIEEAAK